MGPEMRVLFAKEWRQLVRNKTAMATALLVPILLMLVVPGLQMFGLTQGGGNIPTDAKLPPAFEAMRTDPTALIRALLPMFVAMGGLIVPSVTATHTVISERETRTLELLIALPVRLRHVLGAKLLSLVVLTTGLCGGLLIIDAVLLLALRMATPGYIAALFLMLFAAIAYSTAAALLISVLARDFRTASNVNGALFGPTVLVTVGITFLFRSPTMACLALSALFLVGAGFGTWAGTRTGTFERLLR